MDSINQPTTPPQTPDQMHSSFDNSHHSKIIPIIIGAVLLVLVGVGSFILGTKKSQPPVQKACTMEAKLCPDGTSVGRTGPKCEFSPCPTATIDPTANWKTYNEDTYKFLVKYPDGWIVTPYDYKKYPVAATNQPQLLVSFQNKTVTGIESGAPGFIGISISYIKPNVSFTDFLIQEKDTANISTPKPLSISDDTININSTQAHKVAYKYRESMFTQIYIPKDDESVYMMGSSVLNEDISLQEKSLNQILSTFKFTE